MKTLLSFALLLGVLQNAPAQNNPRPVCADPLMMHQADSIKQEFSRQGFMVIKEASMVMQSDNEMPVMVPLTENTQYQFVFIGDVQSRSYEVKMFDWDEKQVAYQKKQGGEADANVISYAYTPKLSEYHMIKPLQVGNGKKNLCGYVMLMKKIN